MFAIFLIIAIPTVLYYIIFNYEPPTCSDGKKNGAEIGVDCGGSCALICQGQGIAPYVRWSRYFQVAPGMYNAVAYVENQNPDAGSGVFNYKFTLYDVENAIIGERFGQTRLRAKEIIPIMQTAVNTGQLAPARMNFEILGDIVWQKEKPRDNIILVADEKLIAGDESTRVSARLNNISLGQMKDISAIVILYDKNNNAIGVSSTFIESISSNGFKDILFTWPRSFNGEISKFEVTPIYESR